LELGVVVGKGVSAIVVCAHEQLQLLQPLHAGQITAKDAGARAVGMGKIIAMLALKM
jgi:hypothetical protein